jgi:hypothetical protein
MTRNVAITIIFVVAARIDHPLLNTDEKAIIFIDCLVFICEITPTIPVDRQNTTENLFIRLWMSAIGMVFCQVIKTVAVVFSIFLMISTIHWCTGAEAIFIMMAAVATVSAVLFNATFDLTNIIMTTSEDATDWMMKYLIILSLFHLFFLAFSIIVNLRLLVSMAIHADSHLFLEVMRIGEVATPTLNAGRRLIF